jgi:hypothetical protein
VADVTTRFRDEYEQTWTPPPTPAPGQIWERAGHPRFQALRVEAFVPETSLGQLVVFTWCAVTGGHANVEHVEVFLRRSTYLHGGPS